MERWSSSLPIQHYTFGVLQMQGLEHPIALGPENVLLRSALFSNTEWGYGIALYTGQETKIQMNNRETATKMSGIEHLANRAIEMVFLAQCTLCGVAVVSIYFMGFEDLSKMPYVYPDGDSDNISVLPVPGDDLHLLPALQQLHPYFAIRHHRDGKLRSHNRSTLTRRCTTRS